jgi:hypothetical protein
VSGIFAFAAAGTPAVKPARPSPVAPSAHPAAARRETFLSLIGYDSPQKTVL